MSDPANPAGPDSDGVDSGSPCQDDLDTALEMLRQVTAWYRQQLGAERQAPAPDQTRVDELVGELNACAAARTALLTAGRG